MDMSANSAPRRLVRRPLDLSAPVELRDATWRHLLAAESRLAAVPESLALATARLSPRHWTPTGWQASLEQQALAHYLSPEIERRCPPVATPDTRSQAEREQLARHESALLGHCGRGDADGLGNELLSISGRLLGSAGRLRTGPMRIRSADQDAVIELPDGPTARRQLERALALLAAAGPQPSLVCAIRVYVALLNAHAFPDGNGRIARLLLNFAFRRAGMPPRAYLPVFTAMHASRGGYEIRLREAEIFGRWDPIIQFFCQVLLIASGPAEEWP